MLCNTTRGPAIILCIPMLSFACQSFQIHQQYHQECNISCDGTHTDPPEGQEEESEVYPQGTAVLLAATPPSCGPVVWPKPPTWKPSQTLATPHSEGDSADPGLSHKAQVGIGVVAQETKTTVAVHWIALSETCTCASCLLMRQYTVNIWFCKQYCTGLCTWIKFIVRCRGVLPLVKVKHSTAGHAASDQQ